MRLEEVGKTARGYTVFVEETEPGGRRYWSDEIGGGVVIFDTTLVAIETIEYALNMEQQVRKFKDRD